MAESYLTVGQVLAVHAQFGRLDGEKVKTGMGPNWPPSWNVDHGIFSKAGR